MGASFPAWAQRLCGSQTNQLAHQHVLHAANGQAGEALEADAAPLFFGFGGKRCGLSEVVLRDFGVQCLKKLDAGQSEQAVKDWADRWLREVRKGAPLMEK